MLALIAAIACGQHQAVCQTRAYVAPTYNYVQKAVATQAYVAPQQAYADQVLFIAVADPRYSAIVGGHDRDSRGASANASQENQLALLTNQVSQLQQSIAAMVGQGVPVPAPQPQVAARPNPGVFGAQPATGDTALLSVLQRKCASCHSDGKAAKGFKMFVSGLFAPLTPAQKGMAYLMVDGGQMPPDGSLTAEEYSLLKNYLGDDRASIVAALKTCMERKQ